MRIIDIKPTGISHSVNPVIVESRSKTDLYYNIKHGNGPGRDGVCSISVDARTIVPSNREDAYVFNDSDYELNPIRKDGEVLMYPNGHIRYTITQTTISQPSKYLILWTLPTIGYTDITYDWDVAEVIGSGTFKYTDDGVTRMVAAPVLIASGTATLNWYGVRNSDGMRCTQQIKLTNGTKWSVSDISIMEPMEHKDDLDG